MVTMFTTTIRMMMTITITLMARNTIMMSMIFLVSSITVVMILNVANRYIDKLYDCVLDN